MPLFIKNVWILYDYIISNEEMNDIIKIVKSLVESNLLRKGNRESIKSKARKQKRWFFRMVICTCGGALLGNLSTGKGPITAVKSTIRSGQDF